MKKAKERLDAEAAYQMTWRQRVENAWFYYRWHVIGSLAAVVLLVMFVHDIASNVSPDYQLAVLTPNFVSDEMLRGVEQAITPLVGDRNGDGKTVVLALSYQMAVPGLSTVAPPAPGQDPPTSAPGPMAVDPNMQMASVTRLSADIQTADSMLFLSDYPVEYQRDNSIFLYNDGSVPPEGVPPDLAQLGVPLRDCPPLAALLGQPGMERLADCRLLRRVVPPQLLAKDEKLAAKAQANDVLYAKLIGE